MSLLLDDAALSQAGVVLSPVGLLISGTPTVEQWSEVGSALSRAHGAVSWAIGDWLLYGEGRPEWGDKYQTAIERFGRSYQTLQNLKSIAKAIPRERRRVDVPWSHHAEVASLEPSEQERLLDEVESTGMRRSELRDKVRARCGFKGLLIAAKGMQEQAERLTNERVATLSAVFRDEEFREAVHGDEFHAAGVLEGYASDLPEGSLNLLPSRATRPVVIRNGRWGELERLREECSRLRLENRKLRKRLAELESAQ